MPDTLGRDLQAIRRAHPIIPGRPYYMVHGLHGPLFLGADGLSDKRIVAKLRRIDKRSPNARPRRLQVSHWTPRGVGSYTVRTVLRERWTT